MQFQIQDLIKGRFKKAVTVPFPSENINENGEIQYDNAHFIGVFVNVSEKEREKHQKRLAELNEQNIKLQKREKAYNEGTSQDKPTFEESAAIKEATKAVTRQFIQQYFVGFEKHPKHPLPFLNGETELQCTKENIAALLDIQLIRECVADVYNDEINKKQNEKLSKLMAGN